MIRYRERVQDSLVDRFVLIVCDEADELEHSRLYRVDLYGAFEAWNWQHTRLLLLTATGSVTTLSNLQQRPIIKTLSPNVVISGPQGYESRTDLVREWAV